jgi:hypothetical protein
MNKPNFYPNAFAWMLLPFIVTLAGFGPSYFMRLAELSFSFHVHGVSATLWMLLLVTQPLLYRLAWMEWHRMVGRSTLLLVPVVVISGLVMVHSMLNDPRYPEFISHRLAFLDFAILLQFVAFYILSLRNISRFEIHARWMICTVFGPFIPAATRLFAWTGVAPSFIISLHMSFLVAEIALIALIIDDFRKGGFKWPYPVALAAIAMPHLIMGFIHEWPVWQALMNAFASL